MQLHRVQIDKPDATNFILGQDTLHQVRRGHRRGPGRRRAGHQVWASARRPEKVWCGARALMPRWPSSQRRTRARWAPGTASSYSSAKAIPGQRLERDQDGFRGMPHLLRDASRTRLAKTTRAISAS